MNDRDREVNLRLMEQLVQELYPLTDRESKRLHGALTQGPSALTPPTNHSLTDGQTNISLARKLASAIVTTQGIRYQPDSRVLCDDHDVRVRSEDHYSVLKRPGSVDIKHLVSTASGWCLEYKTTKGMYYRTCTYLDIWRNPGPNSALKALLGHGPHRAFSAAWEKTFLKPLWQYPIFFGGLKFHIDPHTEALAEKLVRERYGWYSPAELGEKVYR